MSRMNEQAMTLVPASRGGMETSAAAAASLAKATIEAKFAIAQHRPRSVMDARAAILDACKRPAFARGAWYRKPIGKGVEGFSIRFAEQALTAWRNVDVSAVTAWETEEQRLVRISVTDLEANLSYADEVLLNKTVERRKPQEGQEVLGKRTNSTGETVFIIRATEDDLLNKLNAAKSKSIRNSGLRLIPQDILEEAEEALMATRRAGENAVDPKEATRKLADAFNALGIVPSELEMYLGHPLAGVTPMEVSRLRDIYVTIKDGEATWSDYVKKEPAADAGADKSGERDDIPGLEPVGAVPAKPEDPFKAPPKAATPRRAKQAVAPAEPAKADPTVVLANAVITAGHSFSDFARWADESGNIEDVSSLSGFADIPEAVAKRLALNTDAVVAGIVMLKAGGA